MINKKYIVSLSLIYMLATIIGACQKVSPPGVKKQHNGTIDIPSSNTADQPFNLAGQDSVVSLSGTILLWKDTVPAPTVTEMLKLSRDRRLAQAEYISALPDLNVSKIAVTEADKSLKDYISSYYENQHEALLSESRTWFVDALNNVPEKLLSASDKVVVKNKFKSFCEAKVFEAATMFFFVKNNLFSERPSPFALCEGVYSDMGLFSDASPLCAKSDAPKDYYECLWLEGVVKTNLFKTQYSPEDQAYLIGLVTQPNYQGLVLRDMLDDSSIYNELLDTPAGFPAIKLTEDLGCCKKTSDSRPRSAIDKLTKAGTDLNEIIAMVNPRYILENSITPNLVEVRKASDYSKGAPNSKKDKKALRFTHLFASVMENDALFISQDQANEMLAPIERIVTVLGSYGFRPQPSPYALISLSDYQVSATTTYLPNGERPTLTLATDLLASAEANVLSLAPSLLPKESDEFLNTVKSLEDNKTTAQEKYNSDIEAAKTATEKFTLKNKEIVETGINSLLKPENQSMVFTDSGLKIIDKGSYFEFIFWLTTVSAPKHNVCFSKETETQIDCPTSSAVGDVISNELQVKYDQKSGELILWNENLNAESFGFKKIDWDEGNSSFNTIEPSEMNGKRLEIVMYTSEVNNAITVGVGSFYIKDAKTLKIYYEGSLDYSDYAQREVKLSN